MGKKAIKITALSLWSLLLVFLFGMGLYDYIIPEQISIGKGETLPSYPCVSFADEKTVEGEYCDVTTMSARLFGVVSLKKVEVKKYDDLKLIPSGEILGVRLVADGVCVVGVAEVESGGKSVSPAALAGLTPKDIIISINDTPVKTVADVKAIVDGCGGKALSVRFKRGSTEMKTTLTPLRADSDGKYKTGMWIKDCATGIGTVTYIMPETGEFGALGHGVCEEDGALLPLTHGVVTDATVTEIVKGQKGDPGEIKGYLNPGKTGILTNNTDCGVYGVLASKYNASDAIPIKTTGQVKTGKATLRTALDGDAPADYEIEIVQIHGKSKNKSFTVRVTDPRLLEKTGGIVQGMSGSPIIQDGCLVGAVTHVMINDPVQGYGIFIENMLNAAQMSEAQAS